MQRMLRAAGSLRVTIVLLVFGMMLTFLATMAQTQLGIWEVMSRYIRTFLVWHEVPGIGTAPVFPGGWTIGGLLFFNLLAAHLTRFRLEWRYVPLVLIHAGIALLLIGEWVTGVFAREMNLMFDVGQTKAYTEHPREAEFVVIDITDAETDRVYAVHESHLARGKPFANRELPFTVETRRFLQNSRVFLLPSETAAAHPEEGMAERGLGPRLRFTEEPRVVSTDGRNVVSAVVEVMDNGSGDSLGIWAVSSVLTEPQTFTHGGREYAVAIRPERRYLGYSLELLHFTHLRYPGTEIPKRFASDVRLRNPETGEDREIRISMNQPLRYRGKTFYQASYANNDQTSILQVVRNPGWTLPYIACLIVTAGLVWQLAARVGGRRRTQAEADAGERARAPAMGWPGRAAVGLAAVWVCAGLFSARPSETRPDLDAFGALPVFADGRLKALDTMAAGYLRALSGKTAVRLPEGGRMDAREWLLTVAARPDEADRLPVFTIFQPEVMTLLGHDEASRLTLSFDDIRPYGGTIQHQADHARERDRSDRSTFEEAVLQLDYLLTLYWRLRHSYHLESVADLGSMIAEHEDEVRPVFARMRGMGESGVPDDILGRLHETVVRYGIMEDFAQFAPIPYSGGDDRPRGDWVTVGMGFQRSLQAEALHPAVPAYYEILRAWRDSDVLAFNSATAGLSSWMSANFPAAAHRADFEAKFNRLALFWKGAALYVVVFLVTAVSWVAGPRWLAAANGLCWFTWAVHTIGLLMRMYIQERPPVTSLHASALFVGWAAVLIGLLVERRLRNGLGIAGGAALGFLTLVVAHNLGGDGDTIEVMRAVLNSNFWLATHVVVITIGYSAVFIAGALGIAYLIARLIPSAWTPDLRNKLYTTVLGVVGFALLFSFAGTVLGGIWADQSWGRFWGWDPKENGALLIVLWMAVILHLRIGGIGDERLLMVCAVFGNIIVAFSWFGVNMLGVGLHSYGFMEGAPFWLGLFMVSQLGIMALGALPEARRRGDT
ncbi:MAG: cytochrome c biogenesis protein CcsA [Opitutales bacterium]|nr:cytochrome c biogenesis protein CcsA [Opitutales bacterium]